jgi:hypothetical protein
MKLVRYGPVGGFRPDRCRRQAAHLSRKVKDIDGSTLARRRSRSCKLDTKSALVKGKPRLGPCRHAAQIVYWLELHRHAKETGLPIPNIRLSFQGGDLHRRANDAVMLPPIRRTPIGKSSRRGHRLHRAVLAPRTRQVRGGLLRDQRRLGARIQSAAHRNGTKARAATPSVPWGRGW